MQNAVSVLKITSTGTVFYPYSILWVRNYDGHMIDDRHWQE